MITKQLGLGRGMGIGGWLTNYKRFNVLPMNRRLCLTIGDFEHFESYITRRDIQYIASLGMDHIRLGFDQIVLEEAPGVYRECIFKLFDSFIGWCHEFGLIPVLNMHKAIGNYCDIEEKVTLFDSEELQDRFVQMWVAIEKRYAEVPDVMFELLNEVRGTDSGPWNALVERTYTEIRKLNPTRVIIIGSVCWNGCQYLKDLKLYDDDNIIYTWHFYGPNEFTHQQGVLQASQLYYNRKMAWPSPIEPYRDYQKVVNGNPNAYPGMTTMGLDWMRQATQPAWDFQKAHPELHIWCGEFGTIRHCNITYRENWMADLIGLLVEHDMPYSVWNYLSTPNDGNRFSLVDDDNRIIVSPRMLNIIRGEV